MTMFISIIWNLL